MDIEMDKNIATDTVTNRLVEARNDFGITQKGLASATGISVETIKNIEKQHVPSLLYAMRIADFFHQPLTNIFCYHPGQAQCKGADHNGE